MRHKATLPPIFPVFGPLEATYLGEWGQKLKFRCAVICQYFFQILNDSWCKLGPIQFPGTFSSDRRWHFLDLDYHIVLHSSQNYFQQHWVASSCLTSPSYILKCISKQQPYFKCLIASFAINVQGFFSTFGATRLCHLPNLMYKPSH